MLTFVLGVFLGGGAVAAWVGRHRLFRPRIDLRTYGFDVHRTRDPLYDPMSDHFDRT